MLKPLLKYIFLENKCVDIKSHCFSLLKVILAITHTQILSGIGDTSVFCEIPQTWFY